MNMDIANVRFSVSSEPDRKKGLLGWVSFTLNDSVRLDGIAVRRTAQNRLALSFPARRDGSGAQHFFVRPVSDEVRREFEEQVLRALGLPGSANP